MKTFLFAALAAVTLSLPAGAQAPATAAEKIQLAQADVRVRVGGPNVRRAGPRRANTVVRVGPRRSRTVVRVAPRGPACRTVVVKERRGNTVITRRTKRC